MTDINGVARWDAGWAEPVVLPVVLAAALLLALSGFAKMRNHRSAATALETAGLGGGRFAVMSLGTVELTVGTAALLGPNTHWMLMLAALYAAFGGFLLRLNSVDPRAGCGCLGDHSQPIGRFHIVADFAAAGAGAMGWLAIAPGAHARIASAPLRAVTFWVGVVVLAYLIYGAVRFLPTVWAPDRDQGRAPRSFALTR